ncbi:hypothetical protein JR316_0003876 [Psilocybe cubensis]|uniref:Uncharacterized protein n=2 Tax=Psilocybe cubensis TaxID=181762 RepID=A0ACB8H9J3_PSICU|nr:hypothetical protein JR316_0003876 [Psilocybe cubensis]KAH9484395.1 hypothetical protein JR316_0003876 [Psilocybe cubensis]
MSRWIVVDDKAKGFNISYGGELPWMISKGMLRDSPVEGGPPLYNTLHGTNSKANISFDFTGSAFGVYGSRNSSTPRWNCTIDGKPVKHFNVSRGDNQEFCGDTVNDGTHKFVMEIDATEKEQFWFDYFKVLPPAGMNVQADVIYSPDDSLVHCDSDWDTIQSGTMTMKNGSMMTFNFNGASLSWFGVYNSSHHRGRAKATYSVDGEKPVSFWIENTSSHNMPLLSNQPFFQTPKYSAGQHRLEVVYYGNSKATPLTLQHLIVQDSSPNTPISVSPTTGPTAIPPSDTVPATTTTYTMPASESPSHQSESNSKMIGSIAGGVVGGFLFLVIVAVGFFLLGRCRARVEHPEAAFRDVIEPYTHNPLRRSSGYNPLPTSTAKRPLVLGNNQMVETTIVAPRRSIIRSLMRRFTGATFDDSRDTHNEASTLLPSRHSRTRTSASWIVMHEDSGIRVSPELPRINTDIIEIPPTYSAE